MHRISVCRGFRSPRQIVVALAAIATLGLTATAVGSAGAASCGGRTLLTCQEKAAIFPDYLNWAHAFVLDAELFETPLGARIRNPALKQFWVFEASTAAARAEYEFALSYELLDNNFETIFTPPVLPAPSVKPHGVVGRKLARSLTTLMQAEQSETLNLLGLTIAMNRATEAKYQRTRQDWLKWQQWIAAGYARRAASAITRAIRAQKTASHALIHKKLLYGVGSADLNVAHRTVRSHGLAHPLVASMTQLGMSDLMIQQITTFFKQTSFGTQSFSLSQYLAQPSLYADEAGFRTALMHYAARIPPAPQPPS
jgi:hypothetical protein